MKFRKSLFLVHTCPHAPAAAAAAAVAAAAPANADRLQDRLVANDVGNDCTITVNGTDFHIPQKEIGEKGNSFASHHKYAGSPPCATSWWVWTSSCGTWYGSRVLTLPVSILTLKF